MAASIGSSSDGSTRLRSSATIPAKPHIAIPPLRQQFSPRIDGSSAYSFLSTPPASRRAAVAFNLGFGFKDEHGQRAASDLAVATKVCIVSENAYPVLDDSDPGSFGGAVTRAVTFARGLRQAGC